MKARQRSVEMGGEEGPCGVQAQSSLFLQLHVYLASHFTFPPHQESSITFLTGNDVDLIKIFIGFYKIISYIPFPGALQGGGKVGERERRKEYITNEVEKGNILFYSEMTFPG